MANNIGSPFELFTDTSGVPLEDGYIYVGTAGLNPETNPITVYWDDALTIPADQPIRTLSGYPARYGTAARMYVSSDYSLTVKDKNGSIMFLALTSPMSSPAALNGTPIGSITPSTGAFTTLSYTTSLTGAAGASLGWVTLTGGSAAQAINGLYRSAANTVAVATNSVVRGTVDGSGNWSVKLIAGSNGFDFTDGTSTGKVSIETTYSGILFGTTSNHPVTIQANNVATARFWNYGGLTLLAPADVTKPALTAVGAAATTPVAVTFSATAMTLNCALSNVFTTTFTANVTTAPTLSNPQDGQTLNWFITQDATGSRTMTWPASFKWPSGSAGTLSTAANAVDLLVATYRSATGFWYISLIKDLR